MIRTITGEEVMKVLNIGNHSAKIDVNKEAKYSLHRNTI